MPERAYAAIEARFGSIQDEVLSGTRWYDLPELFTALEYKHGAEIGVDKGEYSERLLRTVPDLHLLCVDAWAVHPGYREFKDQSTMDLKYGMACRRLRPYAATLVRKMSVEAAIEVPDGSLDFVYIDANHERPAVDADLAAWAPKVRKGGIVCGHDYVRHPWRHWIQVVDAVNEYVSAHGIRHFVLRGEHEWPSWLWVVGVCNGHE